MSESGRRKKATTNVFSPIHPLWLDTEVPLEYEDKGLFELIRFFVFYSPCKAQSSRSRPLSTYGWKEKPWYGKSYLKEPLDKIIFGDDVRRFYVADQKTDFLNKISGHDFSNDFYNHRTQQRVALVKVSDGTSCSEYMSLFHHIRNSLAHGRLAMYPAHGNDIMFIMEDGGVVGSEKDDNFEVTARIVILKSTLLKIIQLLQSGPVHENDYTSDVIAAIDGGKNTKKGILEALQIDEEIWNRTIAKLKADQKVQFNKNTRKWEIVIQI